MYSWFITSRPSSLRSPGPLAVALKPKKAMPSWLSPTCCSCSAALPVASAFQPGALSLMGVPQGTKALAT